MFKKDKSKQKTIPKQTQRPQQMQPPEEEDNPFIFGDFSTDMEDEGFEQKEPNLSDGTVKGRDNRNKKKSKLIPTAIGIIAVFVIFFIVAHNIYSKDDPKEVPKTAETDNQQKDSPTVEQGNEKDSTDQLDGEEDKDYDNGTTAVVEQKNNVVDDQKDKDEESYVTYKNNYVGVDLDYLDTWIKTERTQEGFNNIKKATKKNKAFNIVKNPVKGQVPLVKMKSPKYSENEAELNIYLYAKSSKVVKGPKFPYDADLYKITKLDATKFKTKKYGDVTAHYNTATFTSYDKKYVAFQGYYVVGKNALVYQAITLKGAEDLKEVKSNFFHVIKTTKVEALEKHKEEKEKEDKKEVKSKAKDTSDSSDVESKDDDLTAK